MKSLRRQVVLVIVLLLIGCSGKMSLAQATYNALDTTNTADKAVMAEMKTLFEMGKISKETYNQAVEAHNVFTKAWFAVEQALETYIKVKNAENTQKLEIALTGLKQAMDNLKGLLIKAKGGK